MHAPTVRESVEEPVESLLAMGMGPGSGSGGGHGGGHGGGGEEVGNTAVVVGAQNLTYIDVGLTGGEDPPVVPDPEPTTPPAPAPAPAAPAELSSGDPVTESVAPPQDAGVPVEVASPTKAQERIQQSARIRAETSSKQRVGTQLVLTKEPIYTDWGVTVRWRVTKKSQDNCTISNRKGKRTVKFEKRGRCTVVA